MRYAMSKLASALSTQQWLPPDTRHLVLNWNQPTWNKTCISKNFNRSFPYNLFLLSICCYLRKWVQATERYIDVLISEEESARDGETYSSNEFYKLRVSLQD
jgi:hypothetical protein